MKFRFFEKMRKAYMRKSAKERAEELGGRIRQAIDEGKFTMTEGYLSVMLSPSSASIKPCYGCAVAAAAFVCGLQEWAGQNTCQRTVVEHNLMTQREAAQLEMGYENAEEETTWTGRAIKRDKRSPFYKLGKAIGVQSNHRGVEDFR